MPIQMTPREINPRYTGPLHVLICSVCGATIIRDDAGERERKHRAHHDRIDQLEAAVAAFGAGDEYVELTGDDIPYHLRDNAPALGQCDRCERYTWSPDEIGTVDQMPQPSGGPCGGVVQPL